MTASDWSNYVDHQITLQSKLGLVHKHSESEDLVAPHKSCFSFASSIKIKIAETYWSNYVDHQIILQRRLGFEAARIAFNTLDLSFVDCTTNHHLSWLMPNNSIPLSQMRQTDLIKLIIRYRALRRLGLRLTSPIAPPSFLANVARNLRSYSLSWIYISSLNPPFLRHQHPSELTFLSS